MIRSELVQKLSDENPHLFQRDVERIVNAIFEEIIEAMANGDRVELRARLRLCADLQLRPSLPQRMGDSGVPDCT